MRNIFFTFLSIVIMSSCSRKHEQGFQKIKYDLSTDYKDSLAAKIIPDKDYQYWAYMSYSYNYGEKKHKVLKQEGDTLQKHLIDFKSNITGFFEGCHPNYCCNYVAVIEDHKMKYIKTEKEFTQFLGDIDNLEEALLLARMRGLLLDSDIKGSAYRTGDDYFELHLMKFHENPPQKESIEIRIDKKGNIQEKSLGIYCEGQKCYQ